MTWPCVAGFRRLGASLFDFVPHNATGPYELQFGVPTERAVIRRLAELAETQKIDRQHSCAIDTSEKGDWENFRHETLNGEEYDFEMEDANGWGGGTRLHARSWRTHARTTHTRPHTWQAASLFLCPGEWWWQVNWQAGIRFRARLGRQFARSDVFFFFFCLGADLLSIRSLSSEWLGVDVRWLVRRR